MPIRRIAAGLTGCARHDLVRLLQAPPVGHGEIRRPGAHGAALPGEALSKGDGPNGRKWCDPGTDDGVEAAVKVTLLGP